jgi:hypothetical protein
MHCSIYLMSAVFDLLIDHVGCHGNIIKFRIPNVRMFSRKSLESVNVGVLIWNMKEMKMKNK